MPRWIPGLTPFVLALVLAAPPVFAADGVGIDEATEEQKKGAQDHYTRGAKEFSAKRFEEAYVEFTASYSLVKSPNAHMMMARALIELGQHALAYNELGIVEREAAGQERYANALEKSRELRAEAAKAIAIVKLEILGDQRKLSKVTIDDIPVPLDDGFGVRPGKVSVRVFRVANPNVTHPEDGFDDRVLELKAGEVRSVAIDLGPADPDPPARPPPKVPEATIGPSTEPGSEGQILVVAGSIATTLGISGLLLGGVLQQLAADDYDALVLRCGEPTPTRRANCGDDVDLQRLRDSGADKQTLATVAFVAGSVTAAVGIGLVIGGDAWNRSEAGEPAVVARIRPGSISLEGRF